MVINTALPRLSCEASRPVFKKCANPFCNRPYDQQGHGKAFVVQFPRRAFDHLARRVAGREHFWLCEECSRIMSLAVRREFDSVSVRIINQAPGQEGKLKALDQAPRPELHSIQANIHPVT